MFISDFTYYSGYFQITESPHPHSNATPKLNIVPTKAYSVAECHNR